jgi:hypothetical protein
MEESQLLRYFMMSYPDFPKCKIEKTESPDFILHLNRHHAIGLEMTRLFVQMGKDGVHFMPKFENEKIELIHLIKQRFEDEFPFKLSAHFDFSDDYYDVNLDLRLLALEICDYMKYKLSGYSPNESFFTRIKSKRLPHWLQSIDIMYHPENELSDWVHCKVNVPADNFLTSIQNSIEHKERKIRLYKKRRMDKYWLLIVAECLNCASPFNINNLLERWEFRTSFHELFLFEMFEQKVYFLNKGQPYNT